MKNNSQSSGSEPPRRIIHLLRLKLGSHSTIASKIIVFIIVSIFFLYPDYSHNTANSSSAGKKTLVMVFPETKDNFLGRWLYLSYTEAFKRLGLKLVYKHYPPKRCSHLSDAGKVDGELGRIYNYNEAHPKLIRVEESSFTTKIIAFAADPRIRLSGWEGLKGTEYKVRYMLGIKISEDNLPKVVSPRNLYFTFDAYSGIKALISGHTDLYVDEEMSVKSVLKKTKEFKDAEIHMAGVMEEVFLHAFLHKKNAALVPKLSTVLHDMKLEGLIEKYKAVALEQH